MAGSGEVAYTAARVSDGYQYDITLRNTSTPEYAIYAFLFGRQFNVPLNQFRTFENVSFISAPAFWSGDRYGPGVSWGTNFQGSFATSGYIGPGDTGRFIFLSTTAPIDRIPFGCGFYNNANYEWGFAFNGRGVREDRPFTPFQVAYNPWWWFQTHGGLVPPGPLPDWAEQLAAALTLASLARTVSPQLRVAVTRLAAEQVAAISASIKERADAMGRE